MRRLVLGLGTILAAGCAKPDAPPAEAPAAPMLNLADLAGSWTVKSMAEASDSVIVTYTMTATGTAEGWTITLPGRDPLPVTVSVSGDSVMTHVGPFESVLRKGVQVTTDGVMRMMGGKMMGTMVAHYATTGADSVAHLRTEGTKNP